MLPASLQQAELELLGAAGNAGSLRSVRVLGACFANLSWGGMVAQAGSARQRSLSLATEMVKKGCGVLLCPYTDQPPDAHLPPDLSGGLGTSLNIFYLLESTWTPELGTTPGARRALW